MERVELLRGANSGLYGQGNLGGIINSVSKAPYRGQVNEVALHIRLRPMRKLHRSVRISHARATGQYCW